MAKNEAQKGKNTLNQMMLSVDFVKSYIAKKEKTPTIIIPLGSLEVHEYLPMGIDSILAEEITKIIAEEFKFLWAPVLPFGHSPEHIGPGVVWFRPETYIKLLNDIIDSYIESGFRRVVFINCHAGNQGLLRSVLLCTKRYARGFEVSSIEVWDYLGKCFNAKSFEDFCIIENSIALYFNIIDKETTLKEHKMLKETKEEIPTISPWLTSELNNMLISTLPKASKELGEKLFKCAVKAILADLKKWINKEKQEETKHQ